MRFAKKNMDIPHATDPRPRPSAFRLFNFCLVLIIITLFCLSYRSSVHIMSSGSSSLSSLATMTSTTTTTTTTSVSSPSSPMPLPLTTSCLQLDHNDEVGDDDNAATQERGMNRLFALVEFYLPSFTFTLR